MKLMKRLRLEKGWSLNELARKSKMANGDIGKIESGRLVPYDSQLEKIAKAFGYSANNKADLLQELEVSS
jgi:transcriptional regulator with XRE-family HTH domain